MATASSIPLYNREVYEHYIVQPSFWRGSYQYQVRLCYEHLWDLFGCFITQAYRDNLDKCIPPFAISPTSCQFDVSKKLQAILH